MDHQASFAAPSMDFGEAIISCFRKSFRISGRASRSEFWFWMLFTVLGGFGLGLLEAMILPIEAMGSLSAIFALLIMFPNFTVHVRRLHDVDRSGWWMLLNLVPLVGFLIILFWMVQPGVEEKTEFDL